MSGSPRFRPCRRRAGLALLGYVFSAAVLPLGEGSHTHFDFADAELYGESDTGPGAQPLDQCAFLGAGGRAGLPERATGPEGWTAFATIAPPHTSDSHRVRDLDGDPGQPRPPPVA